MDVLVASQFLRPVEEVIYIKKSRDISESEILKNAIGNISNKIKSIKENEKSNMNIIRCGPVQEDEKVYNTGVNYESIAAVTLPKGKYIVTISFLVKGTSSWMYIYFMQGQQVIQNHGFYLPTQTQFIPITLRKNYTVNGDS